VDYPVIEPDKKKVDHLVSGIQKKFGLELLGIDVIIENGTGRYGVIDINAFPGTVTYVFPSKFVFFTAMCNLDPQVCKLQSPQFFCPWSSCCHLK